MRTGKNQSGFSLIEVLLALVILSVGLLAIAQLQVAAIHTLTFSRQMTAATNLAEQQLEYLRTVPYPTPTQAPLAADGSSLLDAAGKSILLDDSNPDYANAALGDGIPSSWHGLAANPVDEFGQTNPRGPYYIRWTVERGKDSPTGLYNPITKQMAAPGPQQMVIVLQVIWWGDSKKKPATFDYKNLTSPTIHSTGGHFVELQTVRQANL